MRVGFFVSTFVCSMAFGCSVEQSGPAPSTPPPEETLAATLENVPCRFVVPRSVEGTTFRCADLPVPENRAKESSRSITLHVIVFNGKKGGVPTVALNGGPGGTSEEQAMGIAIGDPSFTASSQKFLDQGDLVLFDQRGVGRSIPRLTCVPEEESGARDAAVTCLARHENAGVDFAGYDSPNSADDVHDLRVALGVKQINLHGISYGSRLALEVLRRHPEDVRAALIDGVLPAQVKVFTETMPNLDAVVTKTFAACAADARCNAAYPNLPGAFAQLKAKLDGTPFGTGENRFDWTSFVATVFDTLYSQGSAGQLPFYIHNLLAQTPAEWDADQRASAARSAKENQARVDALKATPLGKEVYTRLEGSEGARYQEIAGDQTFAMYAAVSCSDSGQYETLDEALAALDKVRPELRAFGEAEARSAFAACRILPSKAARSKVTDPIESSVPTLVIGGEYDPITPSRNAALAAKSLSNAQLVLVPGGAHGQVDACGVGIKTSFLELLKPTDVSCATSQTVAFYYPTNGLAPPSRKREFAARPSLARLRRP